MDQHSSPRRARKPQPDASIEAKRVQAETDLNAAFFKTFSSREGQFVLAYLRGKYVFGVLMPTATADELRHREGQRSIVAEIEQRKEKAK